MHHAPLLAPSALVLTAFALSFAGPPADARPAPGPSRDIAVEAAKTAVIACERMGYKTMATVVDAKGKPVAAMSADPGLNDSLAKDSVSRAVTAAEYHLPSSDVAARAREDAGIYYTTRDDPRIRKPEPGGVPLADPSEPKGAIGVSGSPDPVKDEACAREGAARVAPFLHGKSRPAIAKTDASAGGGEP